MTTSAAAAHSSMLCCIDSSRSPPPAAILRPGIVHRLDKNTSGLIVVAKHDRAHNALGAMFADRKIQKTYIALVHGSVERARGTINSSIARDPIRRTRMTQLTKQDAPPSHTTRSSKNSPRASANSRSSAYASKQAARTRFACIWPPSAMPSSATRSTAGRAN